MVLLFVLGAYILYDRLPGGLSRGMLVETLSRRFDEPGSPSRYEVEVLRKPQQIGVAEPKFRAWMRRYSPDGTLITEGFVGLSVCTHCRVDLRDAVLDREKYRVLSFYPARNVPGLVAQGSIAGHAVERMWELGILDRPPGPIEAEKVPTVVHEDLVRTIRDELKADVQFGSDFVPAAEGTDRYELELIGGLSQLDLDGEYFFVWMKRYTPADSLLQEGVVSFFANDPGDYVAKDLYTQEEIYDGLVDCTFPRLGSVPFGMESYITRRLGWEPCHEW